MLSANIAASRQRWDELMANVASLIPAGPVSVLVDGEGEQHANEPLERATRATGWRLATYDDATERFLAIATRQRRK